jgi:hypothetical protein
MTGKFSPRTRAATEYGRRITRVSGLCGGLVSATALMWATGALADTTISSSTTAAVKTSTANAGAPDNVIIAAGGTVKPASGVAVTLDSNNTVSNSGVIEIEDVSGSAGIQAIGGHTGSVTNAGTITIDETTAATTNSDGVVTSAFATGSNRFGIQVVGPGTFTGDIANSGGITVQGLDSAAISVETALAGSISTTGTLSAVGDRSADLRTTGPVSGSITIGGTVAATGAGAQGVAIGGDVGGAVVVQGAITATGYHYSTRPTTVSTPTLANVLKVGILQGGPALSVAGNVAGGLLIDLETDATTAVTTTGTVASYGQAPAIQIGAVGQDITLGNVGTDSSAYGVVIKGIATGAGVYDGVSATGLQLGVTGGGAVNTSGGVNISGTVLAEGYGAATGIDVNSGVTAPQIVNSGTISANTTTDTAVQSRALAIEAGASSPVLKNSGTIVAGVVGTTGDAVAIVDHSGTLTRIETTGTIRASVTANSSGGLPTGQAVALDDTANTSGLYFVQYAPSEGATTPLTVGAIKLGSGADRLDILSGTLTGDMSFGAGANALNIDGGATVAGALSATGGTLAVNVATGTLQINNAAQLNLTSLDLAATSKLVLTVDPAASTATLLNVAGTANIASGAKIGVRLDSILQGQATYTIIQASQLNVGTIDASALSDAPYLYDETLSTNAAAGTVAVNVALKSGEEIGLPASTLGGYTAVLAAANANTYLRTAILDQTDRTGFVHAYNQMLPEHSSSVFQTTEAATEAFAAPLDDRVDVNGQGVWVQEINYGVVQDNRTDLPGYKAWGVGLVGGYEAPVGSLGALGVTLGLSSSSSRTDASDTRQKLLSNMVQLGGYWRVRAGGFSANAHVAGDYLKMTGNRYVTISDSSGNQLYNGAATGHWTGTGLNSGVRVAYEANLGDFYAKPQVGFDYLRLAEHGYTESGGDALDLSVGGRTSSRLSGFAGLGLGAAFGGTDGNWGPELLVGYRDVVSDKLAATRANFAGGDSFTLAADDVSGQGEVVRFGVKGENGFGGFAVEAGAEKRDSLMIYDLRLAAHLSF